MERARGLGIVMTLAMTAGCGAPAAPAGSSTTPVPLAAPAVGVVAPAPVPRIPETIGGFALPASTRTEPLPDDLLFAIASVDRGMQAWRVGRLAAGARLDDAALAQTQVATHHQLAAARDPRWQPDEGGDQPFVDGGLFDDGAPSGGGRGDTVPGLRHLQAEVSPLQATDLVLLVAATERFDDLAAIAQADPTGGIFALAVDDGAGGTTAWAVRFASGAAPTTDVVPEVGPDDVLVSGHVIVPIAGATIDAPADAGDLELVIGAAVPVAGVMLVADQLIAAGVTRFDIAYLDDVPAPEPAPVAWMTIGTGRYGTIGHRAGTGSGYGTGRSARGAAVPPLRLGALVVTGDLDEAIVRRYIKRHLTKISYCYEFELRARSTLAGTMQVAFGIDLVGKPTDVTATGLDKAVDACVRGVITSIEFPKPTGPTAVTVQMPLTFRPTGG